MILCKSLAARLAKVAITSIAIAFHRDAAVAQIKIKHTVPVKLIKL